MNQDILDMQDIMRINRYFPGIFDLITAKDFHYEDFNEAVLLLALRFSTVLELNTRKDQGVIREELQGVDFMRDLKGLKEAVEVLLTKLHEYGV